MKAAVMLDKKFFVVSSYSTSKYTVTKIYEKKLPKLYKKVPTSSTASILDIANSRALLSLFFLLYSSSSNT